jgi:diguanylate cyclase (GGDEF)-like protein
MSFRGVKFHLSAAFGLLVLLLALVGWEGLSHLSRQHAQLVDIGHTNWAKVQLASEAFRLSTLNNRITMQVFLLKDPAEMERLLTLRVENTQRITGLFQDVQKRISADRERQLLDAVEAARKPYVASDLRALDLLLKEHKNDEAREMMVQETLPLVITYHDAWNSFLLCEAGEMDRVAAQSDAEYHAAQRQFLLLAVLAVALTLELAVVTTLRTTRLVEAAHRAEARLHEARDELERRVEERTASLQRAEAAMSALYHQAEILRQMGDLLQACSNLEEASVAVSHGMRALFPDGSGALYIFKVSRNVLERVAAWGAFAPVEETFSPDDCWGLKRGRLHFVGADDADARCRHGDSTAACCVCIPMVAQGETLGVLHMVRGDSDGQADAKTWWATEERQVLNAVEIVGLALTNLRLRDTLRSLSVRDPLTGLFNRRYMEESLQRETHRAGRRKEPVAVIMIDIDHFKRFNDAFGHDAGDMVLRNLSAFLQKNVRGSDIACRYGGEEFALIMPEMHLEAALMRAEFLRDAAKGIQTRQSGHLLDPITLSMGLAVFPACGEEPEALLKAADTALYRAKKEGRDRICVASGDDSQGLVSERPMRPCIAPSSPAEIASEIGDQPDTRGKLDQGGDPVQTVA